MPFDPRWQLVTCSGCGRRYRCTPTDDYYNATNPTDGVCEPCLLRPHGLDGKVVEGEGAYGLVPITSQEQLLALVRAAQATKQVFDDVARDVVTLGRARFVRALRCQQGYTWRAVAETCAIEWDGHWGSNQLAGLALCERAARMLGEDPNTDPWN